MTPPSVRIERGLPFRVRSPPRSLAPSRATPPAPPLPLVGEGGWGVRGANFLLDFLRRAPYVGQMGWLVLSHSHPDGPPTHNLPASRGTLPPCSPSSASPPAPVATASAAAVSSASARSASEPAP